MALDGVDFRSAAERHSSGADETAVRAALEKFKNAGVSYIRDGGDNFGAGLLAARLAPEYGIRAASPAFAIHRRGRYGSMLGRAYESVSEFFGLVCEAKRLGADFIKIMFSGILDFDSYGAMSCEPLDAAEMKELVNIAHGEGFAVMVHCNGADAIKAAAAAGADSLEHGFYADGQAVRDIAASGMIWVPTFAPVANLIGIGKFNDEVLRQITAEHADAVKLAFSLGASLAPGSDSGAFSVMHGEGIRKEYNYMYKLVDGGALENGARLIEQKFCRG